MYEENQFKGAQLGGIGYSEKLRPMPVSGRDVGEVSIEMNELNGTCAEQQRLIDELFGALEAVLSQNKNDAESNAKVPAPEAMLVPLASSIRDTRKTYESNNARLRYMLSSIRL